MRSAGFFLSSKQTMSNYFDLNNSSGKIRVLCLGESTTASYYSGSVDTAWPKQLEFILNSQLEKKMGRQFVVFNEGVVGTSTTVIHSKIKNLIEEYQPDIVITMMGINDSSQNVRFLPKEETIYSFKRLRIAKLFNYVFKKEPKAQQTNDEVINVVNQYFNHVKPITSQGLFELYSKTHFNEESDRSQFHDAVFNNLNGQFNRLGAQRKNLNEVNPEIEALNEACIEYFKKIADESRFSQNTFFLALLCKSKKENFQETVKKYLIQQMSKGNSFSEQTFASLISSLGDNSEASNALLDYLNLEEKENLWWNTQYNYREIYKLLLQHDILVVSVAYPTAETNGLRRILSSEKIPPTSFTNILYGQPADIQVSDEFKKVIYVSNQNFEKDCTDIPSKTGDCYIDFWLRARSEARFGHTTPKGHLMIAQNIFATLEPIVQERFKK